MNQEVRQSIRWFDVLDLGVCEEGIVDDNEGDDFGVAVEAFRW